MRSEYFKKLLFRYHQFGGTRLVRQYWHMGLVGFVMGQLLKCIVKGNPFKTIYPLIEGKVGQHIQNQYLALVKKLCTETEAIDTPQPINVHQPKRERIFFCWLQGLDSAPDIVKACYNSIRKNLGNREIVVITNENIRDWIELPDDILQKQAQGIIPHAMVSDLVRLELLIRYGGTWIDSTVLCTNDNFPQKILNGDLFLFQYRHGKNAPLAGISNWFISAAQGNKMLLVLRELLYQYWRDYDCVVEYFIFHRFFMMIAKERPEWIMDMPVGNSKACLILEQKMNDAYEKEWFEQHTNRVSFHKLNYRVSESTLRNTGNNYHEVIRRFL